MSTARNNDRYTYVLPYYNFSKTLFSDSNGTINFSSSGDNTLRSTNNLKSMINNDINYQSTDIYSNLGFVSNYGIYVKNLNVVAKNDARYRSSPQSEILNINEFNISFPMIKDLDESYDFLTPKIAFRVNPSNMKNHSTNGALITTDSVFAISRLGLSESYESGKTLTLGIDYRKENKEDFQKRYGIKLGFMSFFVKACVVGLKNFPAINAEIENNEIIYKNYYNISFAVGTERGLVVPVLRNADELSFADIEKNIISVSEKARNGKLTIEDLQGGTFTISNGGVYGSMLSTPILNPPQSGVLGMHNITERPVVIDSQIKIRSIMYLALSYDHRIIDGKDAVSFLKNVKENLEDPRRLFLDI